jgi:cytochrome c5
MKKNSLLILATFLAVAASAKDVDPSKLPPASDKKGVTYAQDIKPIFDRSCIECHGTKRAKAKLRLDLHAMALKGGESRVIEPGESARSQLVFAVARLSKEAMPPRGKGAPLTAEQVGLIRAWIDQGAK